jgi:hypothetical protein
MPKRIRFSELVKHYGKPESIALWSKPSDNPAFMKAVRANRVLTIIQRPTGTKKETGHIGFGQKPLATYLVFPKPLPKPDGADVIGINYDLLEGTSKRVPLEEYKPPKIIKKPKPLPTKKEFRVDILRIATVHTELVISAENISDAEAEALKSVKQTKFEAEDIQDEIKSIVEIK